jgi:hypothetical protein
VGPKSAFGGLVETLGCALVSEDRLKALSIPALIQKQTKIRFSYLPHVIEGGENALDCKGRRNT